MSGSLTIHLLEVRVKLGRPAIAGGSLGSPPGRPAPRTSRSVDHVRWPRRAVQRRRKDRTLHRARARRAPCRFFFDRHLHVSWGSPQRRRSLYRGRARRMASLFASRHIAFGTSTQRTSMPGIPSIDRTTAAANSRELKFRSSSPSCSSAMLIARVQAAFCRSPLRNLSFTVSSSVHWLPMRPRMPWILRPCRHRGDDRPDR